jgi:hypothetical protein
LRTVVAHPKAGELTWNEFDRRILRQKHVKKNVSAETGERAKKYRVWENTFFGRFRGG